MTNHHQHLTYSGRPGTPATTPTTINDHLHRCITTPPRRLLTPETSPSFPAAQRLVLAHASTPTRKIVTSSSRHHRPQPSRATPVSTTVVGDESLCDLHSPSPHAQLELLLREPQGHCHWCLYSVQSSDSPPASPPAMVSTSLFIYAL
ncbi:hypothetical protein DEO72_LG4g1076 [Vigna unguiculata]|uniref:Uncharacterized protein n=1 Tax=Vigna unguiculata TaxID=3917 RepID=A0A4D6LMS1_VIGUN|nr:hypothetical protein DEO72_LG4g1075 [Vigna unguiculata]QCD90122.1 hypothetical protein DEO72_LG4g1076 [Vigna unguiculata]